MKSLAILILSIIPHDDTLRDSVDVIERNCYYDEQGKLVFVELILFDWCDEDERHQCRDWRMVRDPSQVAERDWARGGYSIIWSDNGALRVIRAKSVCESWTQYDPELSERGYVPKEKRRGL